MNREDYFVVVFDGGIASQTFNPEYLLLENVLKAIRRKERGARVYQVGIIPEAVPGAIRRLKERRSEYSGFFRDQVKFYLCWEAWASLRPTTDEERRAVRRISDPERFKQAERELAKFTKKGRERLGDFYSSMVKADETETSDSVVLIKVYIHDRKETKKKELIFFQEGVWFIRADELRNYPKELREAVTDLVVTDPTKADDLTHAIGKAIIDAERAASLFDGEDKEVVECSEGNESEGAVSEVNDNPPIEYPEGFRVIQNGYLSNDTRDKKPIPMKRDNLTNFAENIAPYLSEVGSKKAGAETWRRPDRRIVPGRNENALIEWKDKKYIIIYAECEIDKEYKWLFGAKLLVDKKGKTSKYFYFNRV